MGELIGIGIILMIPISVLVFSIYMFIKTSNAQIKKQQRQKEFMKNIIDNVNNDKSSKIKQSLNTRKLNIISDRQYESNIIVQYNYILKHMSSSVSPEIPNMRNMNKMEEIFIKEFLYQVQFVRKNYSISLIRYSSGEIMVHYNSCPVGRINLTNENNISMQILIGLYGHKELSNLSFEEALQNIRYWISYVKNHLKEQRF